MTLIAALEINQSNMATEIAMIWVYVCSILIKPFEAYVLACKLAKTKDEVFLLFEETAATNTADNMVIELDNAEAPVTAELIVKVKDAVTASLKNDLAVKERRGASKKGASSKNISISTSTRNKQEFKKRKRYLKHISTCHHKRDWKVESIWKDEEVKEVRQHRESLKAKVALKIKRVYGCYPDILLSTRNNNFPMLNAMPLDLLLL